MLDLFRRGEILPDGRTNEEEAVLIRTEPGRGSELEATPGRAVDPA